MKQENKNFLYNILYQVFIFIVPLITTPYISRVLGVNNIGIYSYTYSIVYYFMLGTMLGINNYGARTIARSKDKNERSFSFCSIYYLQLTLGILMLLLYNVLTLFIINNYNIIFIIQNLYLISAIIDINWLFFGLEEFKITISRNILIKILSLILVFLLVKDSNDLIVYTIIVSGSTLISQLFLWLFIKKYIRIIKVSIKDVLKNLKSCLILFVPVIAYGIYRVMDKTMLGLISGTTQLGYYENAEKIINIPICIINALGTVMLPNVSKISNDEKELKSKIYSSFRLCLCFVIPMFFGLLIISNDFSIMFFGNEFVKSGVIIRYLSITIVFSAIANVIRTNYLIPKEKDKIYVISTVLGAVINFSINFLLIPRFGFLGACVGTIIAEFTVMVLQLISVRKEIKIGKIIKMILEYTWKSIIMSVLIVLVGGIINDVLTKIIMQLLIGIIIYFILNYKYIIYDFLNINKVYKAK